MLDPGHRLFARYAHAPNALGYCGPATAAALQRVACGAGGDVDVPRLARQFSGAWPYQVLLAESLSASGPRLDPLSEEVGRAYWTTSELTDRIDPRAFGELLLRRFGSQAGHYWAHLTPDLLDEVAPTHTFHVLGVYPWSRLLHTGLPEPLNVLDSCRIRAGRVVSVNAVETTILVDTLTWDGRVLGVSAPRAELVRRRTPDGAFTDDPVEGQWVAVHWGFLCDSLTDTQAASLLSSTADQIDRTNRRLLAAVDVSGGSTSSRLDVRPPGHAGSPDPCLESRRWPLH